MTIASEITRINTNVANAYTAASDKGATLPVEQNSDNLATAIESISSGGGQTVTAYNSTGKNIVNGEKVWVNHNPGYSYNFDVVGNPFIDNDSKIVGNFSANNYLRLKSYPTNFSSLEMVFKVKTPRTTVSNHMVILGQSTANYLTPQVEFNANTLLPKFMVTTNGASPWITTGVEGIDNNRWVYLKSVWNGNNISLFYSYDGSSWIQSGGSTSCNAVYWGEVSLIGRDNDLNSVFQGLIDLSESYIKVDGQDWWVPTFTPESNYDIVNFRDYNNLTLNGGVILNTDTGVASNFSTGNYITVPEAFNPGKNNWEMVYKVKTPSDVTETNNLAGSGTTIYREAGFAIELSAQSRFGVGFTNGDTSSWGIGFLYSSTEALPNTDYWIKVAYTDNIYSLYISTDGVNYEFNGQIASSNPINATTVPFKIGGCGDSANYWKGSVDLSESYVKIDGLYWWKPYMASSKITDATITGTASANISAENSGNINIL